MFQFGAFAPRPRKTRVMGLSHSDIRGSTLFCSSPQLFAALHVLHRLSVPRHPPCALSCLLANHCAGRPAQRSKTNIWLSPFVLSHSIHTHALLRCGPACPVPARPGLKNRRRLRHAALSTLATSIPSKNIDPAFAARKKTTPAGQKKINH
jgi:hypothetical protein